MKSMACREHLAEPGLDALATGASFTHAAPLPSDPMRASLPLRARPLDLARRGL
jgi:hypothetical protein